MKVTETIATETMPPPREWKRLLWLYLLVYVLDFQLRDWLEADTLAEILADYTDPHMLALQFTGLISFGFYTVVVYWLLSRLYERLSGWQLALGILGIALCGMMFRWGLEEILVKALTGTGNYNPNTSWGYYVRDNSLYAITYCGLGLVFYLVRYAAFQTQLRKQSELERREAEVKFLRSQVNPHFLFNTLNNLYAMVNRGSDKALVTLEKLSGLLRYSLYEQDGWVPIQREINYLKDLVHLESLRIDGLAPIEFEVGVFPAQQQLPPLLLVPFVENAFKHGELKQEGQPLRIILKPLPGGGLYFSVSNLINKTKRSKDGTGGIGVLNAKKRLLLLYPNRHELKIESSETTYTVELKLYE